MSNQNFNKLSGVVALTKSTAQDELISYPSAAQKVLKSIGFQEPRKVFVSEGLIVNDIEANPQDSLFIAVTRKCAKDRANSPRLFWKIPRHDKKRKRTLIMEAPLVVRTKIEQLALL